MSQYTIPNVVDRSGGGEKIVDVYSHLLGNRIIYLGVPIDDGVANTLIAQLLHLEASSRELPIQMYINSPGGSLTAMTAIYDAMHHIGAPVATICVGQAAADAAVLLAAGEPGQRSMLGHARVVLRQPHAEGARGAIPDLIVAADEIARQRREVERMLAQGTGRSIEQIHADLDRDLVLDAQAAQDFGLVDQIL
ncbi:ClpP family protease [Brevibacterium aurantiacum]|uniref:ATP-dependent Clp protease proteolytic subunit n=1 Tax=Brevibacterium aurantiacum TaxID=273384 RepID=A0A556CHK0_BREAU|nr:ATP-dependent Clp protease proteolytic subunit [Brevibacterium aurantiacum]TSI16897.1 ATP-dependent Clp protease proteolytic subunit [Brevibacterium aurantiacum]